MSIFSSEKPDEYIDINNQIYESSVISDIDNERPSIHNNLEILRRKQMLIMQQCKKMRYETPLIASNESLDSFDVIDQ